MLPTTNHVQTETIECIGQESDNDCQCPLGECRSSLLPLLSEVTQVVGRGADLPTTLQLVLELLQRHMQVLFGMVSLYDPATGQIFIHEGIGLSSEAMARGIYVPGEGITGRVVETGQPVIVPSIAQEPAFLNRTGSWNQQQQLPLAFLCVPIMRAKKVMGTLSVGRCYDNSCLLDLDVEILSILAAVMAQVVELHLLENLHQHDLLDENLRLRRALKEKFKPGNIMGNSRPMQEVYRLIDKVSHSKTTVLILGESGVGKERVASAIHYNSAQASGPFVKFNCASLPESVIESELFGHEKGAFTGATARRAGRFEEAHGGTIFLDEVGELSLVMQAKLLRVLQERSFERVGSNTTLTVDLRILAATNRDLNAMVAKGEFREDLYYRLNVFPIMIPPLRQRGSDIVTLADYFVAHFAHRQAVEVPRLTTPVLNLLQAYHWPGNVRELENLMERAVLLADDGVIQGHHLPVTLQAPHKEVESGCDIHERVSQVEYELITAALREHRGNMSDAARHLGITRRILGLRMAKYQLSYKRFRSRHPDVAANADRGDGIQR
jgi:Nif-specific regulatory protein